MFHGATWKAAGSMVQKMTKRVSIFVSPITWGFWWFGDDLNGPNRILWKITALIWLKNWLWSKLWLNLLSIFHHNEILTAGVQLKHTLICLLTNRSNHMGHRHVFQVFPVTVTFLIYQSVRYSGTFTGWKRRGFWANPTEASRKLESLYIDELKLWFSVVKMNWNGFTDDQQ